MHEKNSESKPKNRRKTDRPYLLMTLAESMVAPDPFQQFEIWYEDTTNSGLDIPNAFSLSTVSKGGAPSSRIVLLKEMDQTGFLFYTNSLSRKGRELADNPHAAMCFFWSKLERQLRIEGIAEVMDAANADAYFATRPRDSQIGAWASPQSEAVKDRQFLDEKYRLRHTEFQQTDTIPRPPHWNGYRVIPSLFEFWQGGNSRMHDRIQYRKNEEGVWEIERLAP